MQIFMTVRRILTIKEMKSNSKSFISYLSCSTSNRSHKYYVHHNVISFIMTLGTMTFFFMATTHGQLAWSPIQVDSESKSYSGSPVI